MLRALETLDGEIVWIDTRHVIAVWKYPRSDASGITLSSGIGNEWMFKKTPAQLASHLQEPG